MMNIIHNIISDEWLEENTLGSTIELVDDSAIITITVASNNTIEQTLEIDMSVCDTNNGLLDILIALYDGSSSRTIHRFRQVVPSTVCGLLEYLIDLLWSGII